MVLLFTDVFLLLTQVLLWIVVGIFVWLVLLRALPRQFLGLLVLLLICWCWPTPTWGDRRLIGVF